MPQDATFEIRPSAGKGLGAFATKDIEGTSYVLHEEPLVVIRKLEDVINAVDVETAYLSLTSVEKEQFMSLGFSVNRSFVSRFDTFMRNKYQVMKFVHARDTEPDGQGMYLLCSRFNHSCVPNAAIIEYPPSRSDYAQAIYAIKPIARGEEIMVSYDSMDNYLTTEIRRSAGTWDFICTCPACNVNDPFHYISDMRRGLLRGLYYLLNGVDVPGCEGRKIPVTKEAAKQKTNLKNWPLVKKGSKDAEKIMTWSMLSGYLFEAEGLADMASEHFKNAVIAIWRLCGEDRVAGMQEVHWNHAFLWATRSLEAIKSYRPAHHGDVRLESNSYFSFSKSRFSRYRGRIFVMVSAVGGQSEGPYFRYGARDCNGTAIGMKSTGMWTWPLECVAWPSSMY